MAIQLPPFIARLIGDRSAVVPDLANAQDLGSIGGRFPTGLTTDVVQGNPYRPDIASRDFPTISFKHPLVPIRHAQLPTKGIAIETVPRKVIHPVPRIIPGGRP